MKAFLQLMRPHQWLKNLILFFPPFLGGSLHLQGHYSNGLKAFAAFCLASSATYIVNDIRDRESDSRHPKKLHRPLASGAVVLPAAISVVAGLLVASALLAWRLPPMFAVWLLTYLLLSFAYSFGLKDQPIFDIFCIASGFVFRLFAGGAVFGVWVSDWLFLSVLLLALFLSCGKRFAEQRLLGEDSGGHRRALNGYPPGVLDGFMYVTGAAVLVTYTMYAIAVHRLVFSVPLCCFGLLRYLLLVKRGHSGDPTDSLLKDPILFLAGLSWAIFVGISIYGTTLG